MHRFAFLTAIALVLAGAPPPSAESVAQLPAGAARADYGDQAAAIGRMNAGNGAYCTGTLIAKDVVITAAHCLFDGRSRRWIRPQSLHFLLGYKTGNYDHHARIARYVISPGYDTAAPTRALGEDWAVLFLTEPVDAKVPPLRLGNLGTQEAAMTVVKGYSGKRKYALSTTAPCRVQAVRSFLLGDCKAEAGMSGSPLINVATGEMIGIQVAAGRVQDRDIMIGVPSVHWKDALKNAKVD